jgi:TolA-binding protein
MKRVILINFIVATTLFATEPSVYGAGNLDSAEPYGLTETERSVLENRRAIQNLKNMVSAQQNRIDGLTTIIEGLNREILSLKEQLGNGGSGENSGNVLFELKQKLEQISNNYVTQLDLEEAIRTGKVSKNRTEVANSYIQPSSSTTESISELYTKAVRLFGQRNYQTAKEFFEQSIAAGHKEASSNYYLGEIAYYTKDYASAVGHYKQSASINNTANYMKVLYLHTGIALVRDGKEDKAKPFFKFVVDNYPNTKAAEIAQKNL